MDSVNYELLDQSVYSLKLSTRAHNVLINAIEVYKTNSGPHLVRDACRLTDCQLLKMKNCGRKTLTEIQDVLARDGLELRTEYPAYSVHAYWGA